MRKIIIFCLATILFASCKEERIPLPTGLVIEETDLTFVAEGETYRNRLYTTSPYVDFTIPDDAKEWLSVKLEDGYMVITVDRNESIGRRNATVTVNVSERNENVRIQQIGLPTKVIGVETAITNSENATSGHESILATLDPNLETHWHSHYTNKPPVFWAIWFLEEGTTSIDMVIVTPRWIASGGGANGRFSHFGIWVKGDGTDTPEIDPEDDDTFGQYDSNDPTSGWGGLIGSVDEDGYKLVFKGDAQRLMDPVNCVILPVNNPTEVKLVFPGTTEYTTGGFLAMSYIEFFKRAG